METNIVLNDFRNFLLAAWESFLVFNKNLSVFQIDEATILEERANDWLQANWEILVERSVCGINEFLEFYGDGGDCNDNSSRISFPNKLPTHRIVCRIKFGSVCKDIFTKNPIKQNEIIKMKFLKFTTLADNKQWFDDRLPFDCVLLSPPVGIENVLVSLSVIDFSLEKI